MYLETDFLSVLPERVIQDEASDYVNQLPHFVLFILLVLLVVYESPPDRLVSGLVPPFGFKTDEISSNCLHTLLSEVDFLFVSRQFYLLYVDNRLDFLSEEANFLF